MIGQRQLHDHPAGRADPVGIGMNYHSFGYGIDAGGDEVPLSFHFDQTHPAGPGGMADFKPGAEGRDLEARLLGGGE